MIRLTDVAWLAGLLEGEGCIRLFQGKYPLISLGMVDGDVVQQRRWWARRKVEVT